MSKILIIDDDHSIVELIKINAELLGHEAIACYDGIRGYALAIQEMPDLIILDVMMPEVDGYTVAQRIRQTKEIKDIPIIMLTALGMLKDKKQGFNSGADDYLVKPFELEELVLRIKALLRRTKAIPESLATSEILTIGNVTVIPEDLEVKINNNKAKLTPIEFDIFNNLFQKHDKTVPSGELLKEVWGYAPDDDIETIRVHIRHLRTKLEKISPDKKYIQTVYGGGYKYISDGIKKEKK